jgi:hypothetical protein
MSALTATLRGRAAAEALMVDTCLVRRRTGEATDPDTGVTTPTYATVYAGKCKIQQRAAGSAASASPAEVGEATLLLATLELHVPTSVTGIASDHLVAITASVLDPDLLGRTWTVRGPAHETYGTARRYTLQEVTS